MHACQVGSAGKECWPNENQTPHNSGKQAAGPPVRAPQTNGVPASAMHTMKSRGLPETTPEAKRPMGLQGSAAQPHGERSQADALRPASTPWPVTGIFGNWDDLMEAEETGKQQQVQ